MMTPEPIDHITLWGEPEPINEAEAEQERERNFFDEHQPVRDRGGEDFGSFEKRASEDLIERVRAKIPTVFNEI